MGFPGSSMVKNPPANAGDMGLIPGSGRSPVFLPGKLYGQRSLSVYSPQGLKRVGLNLGTEQQQTMTLVIHRNPTFF